MRRTLITLLLTLALVGVAAGCSSGDGEATATGGPSTTRDPDASTTTTTTADPGAPVPSAGCEAGTDTAGTEVTLEPRTLQIGGVERSFLLTTPATGPDEPLPLVVDLHGLAEGSQIHATMSQYSPVAQEEGFVVVFPQGLGQPVKWDADPASDPNLDLELVDTILETIGTERCIDTSRVYATGLSYGAIMTSLLMCTRADTFAAFAPVAGIRLPEPCEPGRPLPILSFHGTADPILTFDGQVGGSLGDIMSGETPESTTSTAPPDLDGEGYPATVAAWAEKNGCDPEPTDTNVSETVVHRVHDCPEGGDVEFFIIVGGGHSWPGSEFSKSIENIVGPTTFDIDATRESWEFFQRFQLPA